MILTIILLLQHFTFKSAAIFFDQVIRPKFKIKDYWWRYEWQHHGSSHIHGFFWMEDEPSVDALDKDNADLVETFIHFWHQHVSTWHPEKLCRIQKKSWQKY